MGPAYSKKSPIINVYYSNFPPFEFQGKDDKPTGFSMEIFQAIAKKADIPITIQFRPWKRGMKDLDLDPNSVIFTATRNEDREDKFKWVGPITTRSINMYKLTNSRFKLIISNLSNKAALADILKNKYVVGATSGDASEKSLRKQGYAVDSPTAPEINVKRLFMGRHPLLISLEFSIAHKLKKMGKKFSDVEKVAVYNDQYSYFFMFNKNISYELVYRLQKALDIIKYNGDYKKIKEKWLN